MDFYSISTIIALLALLFACVASGLAIHYRKRSGKLADNLSQALEKIAIAHTDIQTLQERYQDSLEFQKNLNEAEITTRLQQPRLAAHHDHGRLEAPERYLYLRSLAQNGMSAEEIAATLSISSHEAKQLVKLSKLANISSQTG